MDYIKSRRSERGRRGKSGYLFSLAWSWASWVPPQSASAPPKADITTGLSPSRLGYVLSPHIIRPRVSNCSTVTQQLLSCLLQFPYTSPYLCKKPQSSNYEHAMCFCFLLYSDPRKQILKVILRLLQKLRNNLHTGRKRDHRLCIQYYHDS